MGLIPFQLIRSLSKLHSAFGAGNYEAANEIIKLIINYLPLLKPDDQIDLLASAGKSAMFHERWKEAAVLFELLCPLAFRYDPDSNATAGDFRNLGICYFGLKQYQKAYGAFKKAREILIIGHAPEAHLEDINEQLEYALQESGGK
jgi:tetratricopeptide (TPR) repeat protein